MKAICLPGPHLKLADLAREAALSTRCRVPVRVPIVRMVSSRRTVQAQSRVCDRVFARQALIAEIGVWCCAVPARRAVGTKVRPHFRGIQGTREEGIVEATVRTRLALRRWRRSRTRSGPCGGARRGARSGLHSGRRRRSWRGARRGARRRPRCWSRRGRRSRCRTRHCCRHRRRARRWRRRWCRCRAWRRHKHTKALPGKAYRPHVRVIRAWVALMVTHFVLVLARRAVLTASPPRPLLVRACITSFTLCAGERPREATARTRLTLNGSSSR